MQFISSCPGWSYRPTIGGICRGLCTGLKGKKNCLVCIKVEIGKKEVDCIKVEIGKQKVDWMKEVG